MNTHQGSHSHPVAGVAHFLIHHPPLLLALLAVLVFVWLRSRSGSGETVYVQGSGGLGSLAAVVTAAGFAVWMVKHKTPPAAVHPAPRVTPVIVQHVTHVTRFTPPAGLTSLAGMVVHAWLIVACLAIVAGLVVYLNLRSRG
jgi:hypothetical protein